MEEGEATSCGDQEWCPKEEVFGGDWGREACVECVGQVRACRMGEATQNASFRNAQGGLGSSGDSKGIKNLKSTTDPPRGSLKVRRGA